MNKDKNTTDNRPAEQPTVSATGLSHGSGTAVDRSGKWLTFISLALTVASYVILLVWNGIVSAGVSAVAVVAAMVAVFRTFGALRRFAIAALVAATVLFVVLMAFVMVISFGLA